VDDNELSWVDAGIDAHLMDLIRNADDVAGKMGAAALELAVRLADRLPDRVDERPTVDREDAWRARKPGGEPANDPGFARMGCDEIRPELADRSRELPHRANVVHGVDLTKQTRTGRGRDSGRLELVCERPGRSDNDMDLVTIRREATRDVTHMHLRAADVVAARDYEQNAHHAVLSSSGSRTGLGVAICSQILS
jgi:hypothetical protein